MIERTKSKSVWPDAARTKIASGRSPTATSPGRVTLAVLSPPVSIDRGSAENSSSRAFWITIDRPKVTTSEGSGSFPSVPFSTPR